MRLALGAVVELVLTQLFLAGEGLQTAVQADGLSLGPAGLLHTAVLLHNLQGDHAGQDTERGEDAFTLFCFLFKLTAFSSQPGATASSGIDIYLTVLCEYCICVCLVGDL